MLTWTAVSHKSTVIISIYCEIFVVEVKEDHQLISQAQLLAKAICAAVDETVDNRIKAQRLIEIYNKLDARSFGTCLGDKFKVLYLIFEMYVCCILIESDT